MENEEENTALEILDQRYNMVSNRREDNGVGKEGVNIPGGEPAHEVDDKGRRRSNRMTSRPSRYKADFRNKKYSVQGVANFNAKRDPKMRKFTEIDQILHVFDVALIQAHGLKKGG